MGVSVLLLPAPSDVALSGRQTPQTKLVSERRDGEQGNGDSVWIEVSRDRRFVAFSSSATNLTRNGRNQGVYVKNMRTGQIERIDVSNGGRPGRYFSVGGSISSDGRVVVFSTPSRLVPRDDNGQSDIYLRNHRTNRTKLLSHKPGGGQWPGEAIDPSISPDGRFVTYQTFRNERRMLRDSFDVYVTNVRSGRTELVSVSSDEEFGESSSYAQDVSNGGHFVLFSSYSTNFSNRDTGCCINVFLRNRKHGTTRLISMDSRERPAGGFNWAGALSRSGRYVFFDSGSPRLGRIEDRQDDCFVRDRFLGRTIQVNIRKDGWRPRGHCNAASISGGGRYVGFWTNSGESMIRGSYQVYFAAWRRDLLKKVSVTPGGKFGNGKSYGGNVSGYGNWIGFSSEATNLVSGDNNRAQDVFVRGPMH